MTHTPLENLVSLAVEGDASALEAVLRAIKDEVYSLALRMLWHPADAEDATQEVLVRIATNLSQFEGRSAFRTWTYRVTVRALLNCKPSRVEARPLSFEAFGAELLDGLEEPSQAAARAPDYKLLLREVKIGCTQAMLLCLDREHRIAYLLGEILDWDGAEAAVALEVPAATFRKRLSRARARVNDFTQKRCGLVNDEAACRCEKRLVPGQAKGFIDAERLLFATHPVSEVKGAEVEAVVGALNAICDGRSLMRSNPSYAAPDVLLERLRVASTSPPIGMVR